MSQQFFKKLVFMFTVGSLVSTSGIAFEEDFDASRVTARAIQTEKYFEWEGTERPGPQDVHKVKNVFLYHDCYQLKFQRVHTWHPRVEEE